ncbi:sirohydrochlorin chelatase [Noviherbaspirillum sp. UKPF54]|uniref:sirohydrochlorin chelatase n=1 Tax=Noviherbaspirillum sp. UKPF54 TaxID=2601898 RepID=UPI0011B1C373|nr:CbiX/SirB N-terminal domain-containing protein [Noviherbaspirillum sp. UKPF54]QDZ28446.1 cobalamin biosynthesis protein CbiX [Noviherbaspirillum sp. UKPF54]
MKKRALVLFAHGARDPRWAEPFQQLQQIIQAQAPDLSVSLAFLDLMAPRLPELVEQLVRDGCGDVTVVPVFFGQGGHVLRDLPLMMEQLRQAYPGLTLKTAQAVGEDEQVLGAIARYCISTL